MLADEAKTVMAVSGTSSDVVPRGPVLLALHGGELTPSASDVARFIAAANGLPLRVLTVVDVEPVFSGVPGVAPSASYASELARQQVQKVRRLVQPIPDEAADWVPNVRLGSPVDEIVSAAEDIEASVIVVDASPRQRVRGTVSGRRAIQVVGRAPCPVLSVRAPSPLPARTIVAACDFSPASIRAAQIAMLLASVNTRFVLVHVPFPVTLEEPIRDRTGALFGADVAQELARVRTVLEPLAPPGMVIETRVLEGRIGQEVLSFAEREQADLIALGTHGAGPVERFFVGSVAAVVLHEAPCNVLVSRPSAQS
ncbi:MAG TPA: universal stress protein [Gemmatimonadaceae bacterium]